MIVLSEKHRAIVDNILKSVPYSFYVFGSRVKGTAKPFSDLDLAVEETLLMRERSLLETMFEESDLPFKVDLIELEKVDKEFVKNIKPDLVRWE